MSTTIHELAERIARWRALDLMLFEACGRWTTDTPDGTAARLWASIAQHHAWHAALWAERLPMLPGLDLDDATGHAHRRSVTDIASALGEAVTTIDRLDVIGTTVLPNHAADLDATATATDPDLDAPTHRVLTLVLADVRSEIDAAVRLRR